MSYFKEVSPAEFWIWAFNFLHFNTSTILSSFTIVPPQKQNPHHNGRHSTPQLYIIQVNAHVSSRESVILTFPTIYWLLFHYPFFRNSEPEILTHLAD